MAPKSNKRTTKAAAPAAKRAKQDPNLVGVLDALKQAEDLPPDCRAMLEAGAPACLVTPPGERHELQAKMVSWIETVFTGIEAKHQEAVRKANEEVEAATAKKTELEGKVAESKAAADAKVAVVTEKSDAVATAIGAVKEANAKLSAAQKAQKSGDAELTHAGEAKKKLEAAIADHLTYLKAEEGFDSKQATAHMKKLNPIAKQLKLDESLLTALPSACAQVPSKRGEFDRMVMDQLEAGIQGRVDELDATLKSGESAAAERAAAVATAQREVEEAVEAEKNASSALASAKVEEKDASDAMKMAQATLDDGCTALATVTSAAEKEALGLDNFKNYNVECFTILAKQEAEAEKAEKEAAPAEAAEA